MQAEYTTLAGYGEDEFVEQAVEIFRKAGKG